MKRFLGTIGLFIIPLIILVIIIFCIPVNRKYAYAFINKGGCEGRSSWLYRNIFEDTTRIDIAFIGTSHTLSAVNDQQVEKLLNDSTGLQLHLKNMAYCRQGRDFDFVLVRDLLQHKKLKLLVLEIRQEESQYGHPDFVHIATSRDLMEAPLAYNQTYIPDVYHSFLFRLQYLRETVTGEDIRHYVDIPETPYGFNGIDRVADSAEMHKRKRGKDVEIAFVERGLNAYPMKYVDRIAQLTKQYNTPLVFLYLPKYGFASPGEEIQSKYGSYGRIIFAPPQILTDSTNWCDQEHLNLKAATQLSAYLANELKRELYLEGY